MCVLNCEYVFATDNKGNRLGCTQFNNILPKIYKEKISQGASVGIWMQNTSSHIGGNVLFSQKWKQDKNKSYFK